MKRRHITLLIGFMLIGALASCTTDTDTDTAKPGATAPLSISSVSTAGAGTKSTTTLSNGTLGVFRLLDTVTGLDTLTNVSYTGVAGVWTANNRNVMTALTTKVSAYSPYNASFTDVTQLPLSSWAGVTSETPSHELFYSLPTTASSVSAGVSNTSFTLTRAHALLRFTLSDSFNSFGTNTVTSFSIYNKNLPASSTINITGASVAYGAITTQASPLTAIVNKTLSSNPVIDVLLPPCTLYDANNTTLNVTIVVGGVPRMVNLDLATNNVDGALAAGKIYPININFILAQPESNCYIVAPGATIYIPVSRATSGNFANFAPGASFTTGLLWSDVSATHVTATVQDRYIKLVAGATEGNSVVYAKNANGDIVWSWHIWVTGYVPGNGVLYNTRYWLDRNLGATASGTSTSAYGLYYQWGRKDPFPRSGIPTYGSTLPDFTTVGPVSTATAIANPYKFYQNPEDPSDWSTPQNNSYWSSNKTVYDPCPVGWRVPDSSFFSGEFANNTPSGYWYLDGTFIYEGAKGSWWSSTVSGDQANYLLSNGTLGDYYRVNAFSVRCVQE